MDGSWLYDGMMKKDCHGMITVNSYTTNVVHDGCTMVQIKNGTKTMANNDD